jgi:hypothetical protein
LSVSRDDFSVSHETNSLRLKKFSLEKFLYKVLHK